MSSVMFNTLKQCCDDFILGSSLIVILSTQIEPVVFLECALKIHRGGKGNLNETKTTSSSNWNHGILMKRFASCYLVSLSSLWTHMGTAYTDQDQVYIWMHSWSQPEVSVDVFLRWSFGLLLTAIFVGYWIQIILLQMGWSTWGAEVGQPGGRHNNREW